MPEPNILDDRAVSQIEARAAKASKGPWESPANQQPWPDNAAHFEAIITADGGWIHRRNWKQVCLNMDFISHARQDIPALCATVKHLRAQNTDNESRIADLERRLRISFGNFPCALCGGPHDFDTSIPSVVWNAVIRARNLPDYLCTTCIVREFVRVGQGFTAQLWNEEFNGVPIEMVVNGQNAKDAALIQEENTSLRNEIHDAAQGIVNEAGKVSDLMYSAARAMRDKCVEKVKARLYDPSLKFFDDGARAVVIDWTNYLIRELQSLTLDQVKPGEM